MKIEKLEELHQNINALRSLNLEDCAALIGEVPNCYLENRWSNCAVRMRKRREIDNNGNHVNGNHTLDCVASRVPCSRLRRSTNPSESIAVVGTAP
jgi:hypothetical protein